MVMPEPRLYVEVERIMSFVSRGIPGVSIHRQGLSHGQNLDIVNILPESGCGNPTFLSKVNRNSERLSTLVSNSVLMKPFLRSAKHFGGKKKSLPSSLTSILAFCALSRFSCASLIFKSPTTPLCTRNVGVVTSLRFIIFAARSRKKSLN